MPTVCGGSDGKKTAELEGLLADANGYLASFESVLSSFPSLSLSLHLGV
jgi:hypothetical protein